MAALPQATAALRFDVTSEAAAGAAAPENVGAATFSLAIGARRRRLTTAPSAVVDRPQPKAMPARRFSPRPPMGPPPTHLRREELAEAARDPGPPAPLHTLVALASCALRDRDATTATMARVVGDAVPPVVLDVRIFADPRAGPLKNHDGHHSDIIGRLCQHRCFEDWLAEVKRLIQDRAAAAARIGQGEIAVVSFCKSGTHRAVAATLILSHVLYDSGLLGPQPLRHTSIRRCGCPRCRGASADLPGPGAREALAFALGMWRGLGRRGP